MYQKVGMFGLPYIPFNDPFQFFGFVTPPGSGWRIGIDRDEDGFLDGDEEDVGSDPQNASSRP
jgi:hypothetical protein